MSFFRILQIMNVDVHGMMARNWKLVYSYGTFKSQQKGENIGSQQSGH